MHIDSRRNEVRSLKSSKYFKSISNIFEIMDIEHTWILWQEKICGQFIGHFVHHVEVDRVKGGGG